MTTGELTHIPTALGDVHALVHDGRLCQMDFSVIWARQSARFTRRFGEVTFVDAPNPAGIRDKLERYFDGDTAAIETIDIDPGGTPFQRRVWETLRTIPAGTTLSYSAFARRLGAPKAARAVGAANGQNPIAIVVPCHRLVASDEALTGYAAGLRLKRALLEHEGALPLNSN